MNDGDSYLIPDAKIKKQKHTKTPWHESFNEIGTNIFNNDGQLIADCHTTGNFKIDEANAKFIVKAVNSHKALLESTKIGLGSFKQRYREDSTRIDLKNCIEFMEKALKLAEES